MISINTFTRTYGAKIPVGASRDQIMPLIRFAHTGLKTCVTHIIVQQPVPPREVELRVAYGGMIKTDSLKLQRKTLEDGSLEWKVDPGEVKRHFNSRLLSRDLAGGLTDLKAKE